MDRTKEKRDSKRGETVRPRTPDTVNRVEASGFRARAWGLGFGVEAGSEQEEDERTDIVSLPTHDAHLRRRMLS